VRDPPPAAAAAAATAANLLSYPPLKTNLRVTPLSADLVAGPGGGSTTRATLSVTNASPSQQFVAVKIKTNAAERYLVRPHLFMLAPGAQRAVDISVVPRCLDEFLAEAAGKPKTAFVLQELPLAPEAAAQVQALLGGAGAGEGDGEADAPQASAALKALWTAHEKGAGADAPVAKHRFNYELAGGAAGAAAGAGAAGGAAATAMPAPADAAPRLPPAGRVAPPVGLGSFEAGAAASSSASAAADGGAGYGGEGAKAGFGGGAYDTSDSAAGGYETAQYAQQPRRPPWREDAARFGEGGTGSLPPQGPQAPLDYGGAGARAGDAAALSAEQAVAMRAEYNRIVAQGLYVQGELQALQHALVGRDREAEAARAEAAELRRQLAAASATAAASGAGGADGLRQRPGAGAGAAAAGRKAQPDEADEPDDNTVKGGLDEGGGCPLYVVMVVGLIMFLIGLIIPSPRFQEYF